MSYFSNIKTSDRITVLFTFFNFLSLIILLIGINIIYFFAWYTDQKAESMYDIDINYELYIGKKTENNIEAFKEYILLKDTLIIPHDGSELLCSKGVEDKIHENIDEIKDKYFYNNGNKTYFIFTQNYKDIGEIKVFFDTTPYVKSQILITKISFLIIVFLIILYYFLGRRMSKIAFENMKQFMTDVSHEFKTPLMIINSEIDLYNKKLEKEKLNKDDTKKLHTKIKEKTLKLDNLIETFLLLSRIENSMDKLPLKEVNLEKHIKCITEKYILNHNLNISYKFDFKTKLKIEESTFNLIFENILSNAIKFSTNKLSIEGFNPLQATEGNNSIIIEVGSNKNSFWIKDNGEGMNKKQLENIWKKFYRNDINKEGFGVGLFIVQRLVKLYGWRVDVESEKRKGSKFIINF